ncbi:MAG: SWIM zinc finger family protein, partial [Actinomycetes bacterium]
MKGLKVGAEKAAAAVRGTRTYQVNLWLAGGAPDFSCTCPVAADGLFCKHCVAVGLVLSQVGAGAAQGAPAAAIDLRAHLEGLDKGRLVDLVLEQAERDELLQERLLLAAAKAQGARLDLAGYRRAIDDAMDPGGYVDYRAMYDYASGVDDLIGSLR